MAVMQAHLADWPADEVVSRLQARRLITAKAASLTDLAIADAHLRAREYWEQVETPAGPKRVLGPPFRLKATPRVKVSDAPRYGDTPAPAPRSRPAPQAAVPPADTGRPDLAGPLHGLRVLELTTAWAGPMAGRVLAFLSADVIHVEHATRVDLWRHHRQPFRPSLYPGGDGGARPYNRNALFNSQNINKRSLTLDIKAPAGLAVARELAATCDIVLANFTPGGAGPCWPGL